MVGDRASQQHNIGGERPRISNDLGEILDGLATLVRRAEPSAAVSFAQKAQRTFHAIELAKLAEMKQGGASSNETRRKAAAGGTRSKKAASKAKKRADVVDENPDIAEDIENGGLGDEHIDALANASERSGGDAAKDATLIGELKDSAPDDAAKITNKWLERREDTTETRYERQRSNRAVFFGSDKVTGCDQFTARGDSETIAELKRALLNRANEMYKADGGRDVPKDEHPRTHHQRMYDALCELVGGSDVAGTATDTPDGAKSRARTPHPRAMMHVFFTVDDDVEAQIRAATASGDGYLPQAVLDRYGCASMFAGTVFNQKGEVLWFGRHKRYATPAQFAALIARDGGCVVCNADPARCEAHHLLPWHAPGRGETDIEDLALVCTSCHHWLHESHPPARDPKVWPSWRSQNEGAGGSAVGVKP